MLDDNISYSQKTKIIKEKFKQYNIRKSWIKSIEKQIKNGLQVDKKILMDYQLYIELFNCVLDNMNDDLSFLLKTIYIDKKDRQSLYMSESTFYLKHKNAINEFLSLWINDSF